MTYLPDDLLAQVARARARRTSTAPGVIRGLLIGLALGTLGAHVTMSVHSCGADAIAPVPATATTTAVGKVMPKEESAGHTAALLPGGSGTAPPRTTAPASPLAIAISLYPSTGKPSLAEATVIADLIDTTCADLDGAFVAALMSVESGFRADAVGIDGLGLMGLNPKFLRAGVDPMKPEEAVPEGCLKMRTWAKWHTNYCTHSEPHLWICHWFGGRFCGDDAILSAAKVMERAKRLRAMAMEAGT